MNIPKKLARSFGSDAYSQWAALRLALEYASDENLIGLIEAMIVLGFNTEPSICDLARRMGGTGVKDRVHALLAKHEQDSVGAKLWHHHSDGHFTLVADNE